VAAPLYHFLGRSRTADVSSTRYVARILADEGIRHMNRSHQSLVASLAVAVCLWPVAVAAQDAPASASPTVAQVRGVFASAGYQVDSAISWDWTSPPVSTFRVHDPAQRRELMVLVYPNAAAAQTGLLQAQANEQPLNADSASASGHGPHLVRGYGESAWRGNVALVQSTQAELDRLFRLQNERDNGMDVPPDVVREPGLPSFAVDLDFLQALDSGAINF
jgi:hypothetical protein